MKKKWISLMLALALILSGTAVSADTLYAKVSIDQDIAKDILADQDLTLGQRLLIGPVLSLMNDLGLKVTTLEDGAQVDLDLNGDRVLSLGFSADEEGMRLASSLIPGYILSLKRETVEGILNLLPAAFGAETGESAAETSGNGGNESVAVDPTTSDDPGSFPQASGAFDDFAKACSAAVVPGEPVSGEYEFEEVRFDTMVPITVDMPAIREAFTALAESLLTDETIAGKISLYSRIRGREWDPEKIRASVAEFESHFPDTVSAAYYYNSDGGPAWCVTGEARNEGEADPFVTYQMVKQDEKTGLFTYDVEKHDMHFYLRFAETQFLAGYWLGEKMLILSGITKQGDPAVTTFGLHVSRMKTPLVTVQITSSSEGERTLPLEDGNKTELSLEDLLSGKSDAGKGLITDLLTNGFGSLTNMLSKQSPQITLLLSTLLNSLSETVAPETETPETKAPEAEPQAEENPTAWKTLGDMLAIETGNREATWNEERYALIIDYAGTKWLAIAPFSEELENALYAVDFFAEDREEQINAILSPLEITSVVDLATLALPQEELDQWIGKTGQDLLDAGWEYNGYRYSDDGSANSNDVSVCMVNGRFQYLVSFTEKLTMPESFDEEPDYAGLTISGVKFDDKSWHFFDEEYAEQK